MSLVNRELAVIIRARAASRAGEIVMTVISVCLRIAFDDTHCFKSDADQSSQIKIHSCAHAPKNNNLFPV